MLYSIILITITLDALLLYFQSDRLLKSVFASLTLKIGCFLLIISNVNLIIFFQETLHIKNIGEAFLQLHFILMVAYLIFVISISHKLQTTWSIFLRFLVNKGRNRWKKS